MPPLLWNHKKEKKSNKRTALAQKKNSTSLFSNSWADHVCGMSCQSNTYTSSYTYIIFNVFKKRNPLLLFERCEEWLETDNLSLELLFELWGGVIALTRSWWCDIVKAIFCLNFFSSCQLGWIFFKSWSLKIYVSVDFLKSLIISFWKSTFQTIQEILLLSIFFGWPTTISKPIIESNGI